MVVADPKSVGKDRQLWEVRSLFLVCFQWFSALGGNNRLGGWKGGEDDVGCMICLSLMHLVCHYTVFIKVAANAMQLSLFVCHSICGIEIPRLLRRREHRPDAVLPPMHLGVCVCAAQLTA